MHGQNHIKFTQTCITSLCCTRAKISTLFKSSSLQAVMGLKTTGWATK